MLSLRSSPAYCRLRLALWLLVYLTVSAGGGHAEETTGADLLAARAAMERGAEAIKRGNSEEAVAGFSEAANRYAEQGDTASQRAALRRLAEAQQETGQYQDAAQNLEAALALFDEEEDKAEVAATLGSLGNVYIALGPPERAREHLERAASMARGAGAQRLAAAILNNLGNHYASQNMHQEAIRVYQESVLLSNQAGDAALAARAGANAARVWLESGDVEQARRLVDLANQEVRQLPPSHDKAYVLINLGRTYHRLGATLPESLEDLRLRSFKALREAEKTATAVDDSRALSFALGYMGELYEEERRFAESLQLTRRAISQAQRVDAREALYLWHWQAGRLLEALGEEDQGIASYVRAVEILQELRHELTVAYATPETSFRDSVGPVYFDLVDLLLRRAAETGNPQEVEALLAKARETVELFKVAELRDYFRDECAGALQATVKSPWEVSHTAVVVYPILLPQRTELLVTFGSRAMKQYSVPVGFEKISAEIRALRRMLEKRTTREYLPHAQKLYDWLIRPFHSDLADSEADTLVFVLGGALRTIPMSALHDGRRFLIEHYGVAVTPGIDLTDPRPLDRGKIKFLLAGLSRSIDGYPPLSHVPKELDSIQELFGGQVLLDEGFRLDDMEQALSDQEISVVHVATHAKFSGEVEDSYLLAYDGKLTVERLSEYVGRLRFRDTPLELLTLSACDTAQGDERAALGLSGIAIKAGARSALGSLWAVNDLAAAELVIEFYTQLQDESVSRAEALRRAQLKLLGSLSYWHPGYWSAFLLISNWL